VALTALRRGQAFGSRAKQTASSLAFEKEITVQTYGHDKYTRTLGDVILPGGMNLNQELVKQGWCWWYRKYAPGNMILEELETRARASWGTAVGRSTSGPAMGVAPDEAIPLASLNEPSVKMLPTVPAKPSGCRWPPVLVLGQRFNPIR
jgi:hypothetical protein